MPGDIPGKYKTISTGAGPEFQSLIRNIEAELQDGAQMIGEMHVNTPVWAPSVLQRSLAANGPLMQALWELAAKYDVPLMVHYELHENAIRELENILSTADNKVILILAHCGSFTGANPVWRLMEKYPNLNCDLANREHPRAPNVTAGPERMIYWPEGVVPGWKALIEAYPDRFAVGSDTHNTWSEYEKTMTTIRKGLLANLSPTAARKVAYENAARWLKIKVPQP